MSSQKLETIACTPVPVNAKAFSPACSLPFGLTVEHIRLGMQDFLNFLGFVNTQLATRQIQRLESFLMPANFSSLVGEFMAAAIPRHCATIARNTYHNGHPDLVPKGGYVNDSVQHGTDGIEIKASRYTSGWQGHNVENVWLMVFVFDSNNSRDAAKGNDPRPFQFVKVVGAMIAKSDWRFSGRSATSRRTITASVIRSGYEKMEKNWIYRA